jgi:hypothetical protein
VRGIDLRAGVAPKSAGIAGIVIGDRPAEPRACPQDLGLRRCALAGALFSLGGCPIAPRPENAPAAKCNGPEGYPFGGLGLAISAKPSEKKPAGCANEKPTGKELADSP